MYQIQVVLSKLPTSRKTTSVFTPLELEMAATKAWSSKWPKMEEAAAIW